MQTENLEKLAPSEKERLEVEKLRIEIAQLNEKRLSDDLERQKTSLEVQDLERRWYRKPQYLLAALPTGLAIIGILVGFYTGYFKDKIAGLQGDISKYEQEKKDLKQRNEKSQENLQHLDERIQQLDTERGEGKKEVEAIKDEMSALRKQKEALDRQVGLLNTEQGLNQAELQRAQAEFGRLNTKRQELEGKIATLENTVSTADIKTLAELWLTPNGGNDDEEASVDPDGARAQIVALFNSKPLQQKQYVAFLEGLLNQSKSELQHVLLGSLLLELTRENKWKEDLVRLTRKYARSLKTDKETAEEILKVIAREAGDNVMPAVFDELEANKLDASSTRSLITVFFPNVRWSRAYRGEPENYFRLMAVLKELAARLDKDGLLLLRRYSATCFFAMIAHAIQNSEISGSEKYFDLVKIQKGGVLETLEIPKGKAFDQWKDWAEKPKMKRLVDLWFEDDFKTLKNNQELLKKVVSGNIS